MKRLLSLFLALGMTLSLSACQTGTAVPSPSDQAEQTAAPTPSPVVYEGAHTIVLSSTQGTDGSWTHTAAVDGETVTQYDYTWHCDPSEAHDQVKNAPAEYYTGTQPGEESVYIAHDVFYYPQLPTDRFVRQSYDGEQEWCYYYTDGVNDDYIFATLPVQGSSVPTQMMHTPEEAYQNAVLHITQPGTYVLEGQWHGQIWIDLGDQDQVFADPTAVVTVVLNGVDVTCTVAPAMVFYSVYESDQAWLAYDNGDSEDYTPSKVVDTSDAGANVIVADGTVNSFNGTNIYRMLKTSYKKNQEGAAVPVQKKQRKTDAAFYSYVSMNIDGQPQGTGVLNITSGFEGLDTEQHLTINGGSVNIFSQDDGVNVNEDGVSVVTFNGGSVHILAGLGSEGDGVDSNGFLVVNGGTVISMANPNSDSGLDSDCGSYINGGTVVALGSTMDWVEQDDSNDSSQVTMNLQFASYRSSDEAIIVTDLEGSVVFAYDPDQDEVAAAYIRRYQGAILSFPSLTVGETYHIYVGGDVSGADLAGVYDVSTVTGFSEGARLQSWSGTFQAGRPGMGGGKDMGGFGGGQLPDGVDPSQFKGDRDKDFGGKGDFTPTDGQDQPQMPADGQTPPDLPTDGQGQPQMPADGQTPPDLPTDGQGQPQMPADGQTPPDMPTDGQGQPQMPTDGQGGGQPSWDQMTSATGEASTEFCMEDMVNNFSGVADVQS